MCYTVTEKGVSPGIAVNPTPYPHVGVGDPRVEYDYRRVEVDPDLLAASATSLSRCAYALDQKDEDKRRASYKLVTGSDDDSERVLVKLSANCGGPGGRTRYVLARNMFSLAKGWYSDASGSRAVYPEELVILNKDQAVQCYKAVGERNKEELAFTLRYDGKNLQMA